MRGQPRLWKARTRLTLEWNAPTRDFAIAKRESAGASRTTMERLASVRFAPTIVPDVEFACPKRLSPPLLARRTPSHGTPINTWDASVMMGTVVRTVLRRSARQGRISSAGMEAPKDATALDVATAFFLRGFARASRDIMETGASTRQFSAKRRLRSIPWRSTGQPSFVSESAISFMIN
jgi:hypothetical protein